MEGLKDALQYVNNLCVNAAAPEIVEIEGKAYCTKSLTRYGKEDIADSIDATTLTSLIDYINGAGFELRDKMVLQVVSPTKVKLMSQLLKERNRETLFVAEAMLPKFIFDRSYSQENFVIGMQACFMDTDDKKVVLKLASNIVNTQSAQYSDDGITQQAVMRTGITSKNNVIVPNPVKLIPYRTFTEVEQPVSDFIFRVSTDSEGEPSFKLVEADGGAWKMRAMHNIKKYLVKNVPKNIIVIA